MNRYNFLGARFNFNLSQSRQSFSRITGRLLREIQRLMVKNMFQVALKSNDTVGHVNTTTVLLAMILRNGRPFHHK